MIGDLAAGSIPGTEVLEMEPQLPGLSEELTTRSLERLTTPVLEGDGSGGQVPPHRRRH
jgi:hypothetical protein